MGYNTSQFKEADLADDFICSICKDVLKDPVQGNCEHLFCRECIQKWLQENNTCPNDRKRLGTVDLKLAARYFKNILGRLLMTCRNAKYGCQYTRTLENVEEIETHQQNVNSNGCSFDPKTPMKCLVEDGCAMSILRQDLDSHNCIKFLKDENEELKEKLDQSLDITYGQDSELSRQKLVMANLLEDVTSIEKLITDSIEAFLANIKSELTKTIRRAINVAKDNQDKRYIGVRDESIGREEGEILDEEQMRNRAIQAQASIWPRPTPAIEPVRTPVTTEPSRLSLLPVVRPSTNLPQPSTSASPSVLSSVPSPSPSSSSSSSYSNINAFRRKIPRLQREQDEGFRCSTCREIYTEFPLFLQHVTTTHGATVDSNYRYNTNVSNFTSSS